MLRARWHSSTRRPFGKCPRVELLDRHFEQDWFAGRQRIPHKRTGQWQVYLGQAVSFNDYWYHIRYEDGDEEDMSFDELKRLLCGEPDDSSASDRTGRIVNYRSDDETTSDDEDETL